METCKGTTIATCVLDDALRLETKDKLTNERGALRITLVGRTRATIKNLRIIELAARTGAVK